MITAYDYPSAQIVERSGVDLVLAGDTAAEMTPVALARAVTGIDEALAGVQASLVESACDEQELRTLCNLSRYDEVIEHLCEAAGFVTAPWCGRGGCERRAKEDSSATIRCLPLGAQTAESRPCVCCGRLAAVTATWAQAY